MCVYVCVCGGGHLVWVVRDRGPCKEANRVAVLDTDRFDSLHVACLSFLSLFQSGLFEAESRRRDGLLLRI